MQKSENTHAPLLGGEALEVDTQQRREVTADQAAAVVRSIKAARDGAAKASMLLALGGLGESGLWRRMDALECEMQDLLAGLKPALFFE